MKNSWQKISKVRVRFKTNSLSFDIKFNICKVEDKRIGKKEEHQALKKAEKKLIKGK
jgi:hypothetical protein